MLQLVFGLTLHCSRSRGNRVDLHHAFRQTCQNFASCNWRLGQKRKHSKPWLCFITRLRYPPEVMLAVGQQKRLLFSLFRIKALHLTRPSQRRGSCWWVVFPDVSFGGLWVWVLLVALIDWNAFAVTWESIDEPVMVFALLLAWTAACLSQLYLSQFGSFPSEFGHFLSVFVKCTTAFFCFVLLHRARRGFTYRRSCSKLVGRKKWNNRMQCAWLIHCLLSCYLLPKANTSASQDGDQIPD